MPEPSQRSLDQLLEAVRRCHLCEQLPLGPRPLLQGSVTSKILIAGQAPGRRAHERGIPFDDASGDRLRAWLGIDRATFYDSAHIAILPMGFCYPGTGERGDLPPRAECAAAWRNRLLAQLPAVEITVLIGLHAQHWHLQTRGARTVAENVANWKTFWPATVPLPHPSPRNARWLSKHPFVEDLILPKLRARVATILA